MNKLQTINSIDFKIVDSDYIYDFQKKLTEKLENISKDFDQNIRLYID